MAAPMPTPMASNKSNADTAKSTDIKFISPLQPKLNGIGSQRLFDRVFSENENAVPELSDIWTNKSKEQKDKSALKTLDTFFASLWKRN